MNSDLDSTAFLAMLFPRAHSEFQLYSLISSQLSLRLNFMQWRKYDARFKVLQPDSYSV